MTAVLFDVPGPRARRRNRILAVVGVALVVAFVGYVLYRLAATGQFESQKWSWILYENIQLLLLGALLATLKAFALAAVLSLLLGALLAAARLSDHAWLARPATVVVEFFRAIPVLVLIFTIYFGLPSVGITVSTLWAVVVGLTLYNGSVLAEIFRAGVVALPRGQSEAAYALGMRKTQVMTSVLLPQALTAMLPTIVSQLVVVLKDTALGFLIGYPELLFTRPVRSARRASSTSRSSRWRSSSPSSTSRCACCCRGWPLSSSAAPAVAVAARRLPRLRSEPMSCWSAPDACSVDQRRTEARGEEIHR